MYYIVLVYRPDGGLSLYQFENQRIATQSIVTTFGKCEKRAYRLQTEFIHDGEIVCRMFARKTTAAVTLLQ